MHTTKKTSQLSGNAIAQQATTPVRKNPVKNFITVVRDHHSAAREAKQCVFKRFKSFDIKIVGRFVEQQQVAALLQ